MNHNALMYGNEMNEMMLLKVYGLKKTLEM